ncbi:Hypothetical predicted protein [Podarcis lilfordi]|uniref:Fucolectin tachylectin-4 pentraxin-1 domain-containing protein n=1 Tax=Podarcis lilfordi TaxID=74358 RepID=A0AA35KKY7_9SAUR|nr:Hypothetical predicted protein [Podarcis lilfordi]
MESKWLTYADLLLEDNEGFKLLVNSPLCANHTCHLAMLQFLFDGSVTSKCGTDPGVTIFLIGQVEPRQASSVHWEGDKNWRCRTPLEAGKSQFQLGEKNLCLLSHQEQLTLLQIPRKRGKMLLVWTLLLPLVLLARRGEAQSSEPDLESTTVAPPRNLARGRPACQSSTSPHPRDPSAGKAVDGNSDGVFNHASCTHTHQEYGPWWHVELDDRYAISSVVVKNRADCCSERLLGAQIRVGDHVIDHGKFNPLCGTINDYGPGSISTISCQGMKGRYVSVNHSGLAILTLCEVEVYGTKLEDESQG